MLHRRSVELTVLVATLFSSIGGAQVAPGKRIIGYFTSWGVYARNYHVADIPATKVTHINYAFANISGGKIVLGDAYADTQKFYTGDTWNAGVLRGSFNQLAKLKKANPKLRTLISVGGWTWSGRFSDVALTATSRKTFAQSCVDFMVKYQFDGVDLDWEYPVAGGLAGNKKRTADKQNFTLLLAELRSQLDAKTKSTKQTYLLTIATSANPAYVKNLEIAKVKGLVDWVNVMTYDFHGPWGGTADKVTSCNAALYPASKSTTPEPYKSTFNLAHAAKVYLDAGVPRNKINLGVPFYGRGFGNVKSTKGGDNGLWSTYSGPSPVGTWEKGVFDYQDLATKYIDKNGYKSYWQGEARVPWLFNPATGIFISYDDSRSIREKAWFVKSAGLGGAMFWEFSGDRKAVLLSVMAAELFARPSLRAPVRRISTKNPLRVDLFVEGGAAHAKRPYIVVASMSGRSPGTVLPGGTLPLNIDPVFHLSVSAANGALFPGSVGVLDAQGRAKAGLDTRSLKPLPIALVGLHVTMCGWIMKSAAGIAGDPTNPVDLLFVQ